MGSKYDEWNILKKKINSSNRVSYFRENQIWWCSIGINIGSEIYGKGSKYSRPVLIFRKLSKETFLGIPLSSKNKRGNYSILIYYKNQKMSALLNQMRVWDKKRLIDKKGEISLKQREKIKTGLLNLFKP